MRPSDSTLALLLVTLLAAACGGAPPAQTAAPPERTAAPAPVDTLTVAGLRGTLSQHEIQSALEPKMPKFLRCVQKRLATLDVLSGTVSFAFHVAVDGRVVEVQPSASTLGDRETERCMLQVAASMRFPPPHGGEADLTWPLEVPLDPDVRAPVELDAEHVRALAAREGEALRASCGGEAVAVTAYVDPDGKVLAAGVAAPGLSTSAQLDCISEGVRAWQLESPGSYLGKVSFALP